MHSLKSSTRVGRVPVFTVVLAMVVMVPLAVLGPIGARSAGAAQGTLVVNSLQTDALINPVGINDLTPALSWSNVDSINGATQTGYEIQAASTAATLASGSALLWDSGQVSSSSQQVSYAGTALASRSTVAWQVRVWDSAGQESAWSQVSTFVIGLTKPSDWTAQWITNPNWTGANAGTSLGQNKPVIASFSPVQAQYLELSISQLGLAPAGSSQFYAQLAEIQVFGPANPTVDLALGAKVTASSSMESYGWSVNDLTNGETDSLNPNTHGWSSQPSSSANISNAPITVTINLGSLQSVSSVALWPRTDLLSSSNTTCSFPTSFAILTATSLTGSGSGSTTPTYPTPSALVTLPSAVQARYVEVSISSLGQAVTSASTFYAQLAEIGVYGPNSSGDLALNAPVTVSSSIEGYGWGAKYLTDGVVNTLNASAHGWSSASSSSPTLAKPITVVLDLGSVQSVSSVTLYDRDDVLSTSGSTPSFPTKYAVLTSTASSTTGFTQQASVTNQATPPVVTPSTTTLQGPGTTSGPSTFTQQYSVSNQSAPTVTVPPAVVPLASTVQTQYVRLSITKLGQAVTSASTFYAQLAEIGVYGPNSSTDLALNASVTSSDSIEGYGWGAAYLTDGVTNTLNQNAHGWSSNAYSSATLSTPITVTINLGSIQSVSSVRLYQRDDVASTSGGTPSFPVNYSILTSATSSSTGFTTQATVTNQTAPPVANVSYASLPLLAKQFVTTGTPVSAALYFSGEGIVIPSLNGQNVGNEVLEPGDSNSADQIGYQEYDVTSMLNANGPNAIGIALGLGSRYIQPTSNAQGNRYDKYSLTPTSGLPRAIAQLEITYADGSTQTIATDGSWTSALGPTTVTAWFGGESYDARLEIPNWNVAGGPSASWSPAVVTTAPSPTTVLAGLTAPPLQVVGENPGQNMGSPVAGSELYNFGVNEAGWEQFTISAPAGTTLTFTPAQELKSGQAYQDGGTTGSPVYDTFTSNGTTETWHPQFDYHGFQYVQVSGIVAGVTLSNPQQVLLRAANQSAGTFSTSSSMINSINGLVNNALTSNMYSILTDTPSREKLGWNEEVWLLFPMIARLYNVDAYGRSLEANLAQAQTSSGLVPDTAPYYTSLAFSGGFYDDVNWGSAIIQLPWELYQNYGDTQTMATYYSNMQAYLAYLQTKASGNLVNYSSGLGDWGETSVTSVSTPVNLVENWGYYRDESAMAAMATALGKTSDAATYSADAAATLAAFTASWYNASTKTVANGTQAAIAMALNIGAVPANAVATVTAGLVSAINSNGGFAVGEIGLVPLFQVLSAAGDDSLIFQDVTANKIGSYGYFVDQGLTTLPEYWNITSGSLDQWMLGEGDLWLNSDLVGIQQSSTSNDFDNLVIKPSVVGGLTSASGTLQTNHGLIAASWSSTSSSAAMAVTIPTGSVATVCVPIVGGATPTATVGATYLGSANGYAQYSVGSGTWNFTT